MNKIAIFDTSQSSLNMGDYIIKDSAKKEMNNVLANSFVVQFPTHSPVLHSYQVKSKNHITNYIKECNYKFILGTNILKQNMFRRFTDWNVNIFNCYPYRESILVGCGLTGDINKINFYTRYLYKKILSKKFIHSVRDEKTKVFLEKLGLKAINTGCPTLWSLTREQCKRIPRDKSKKVVFTLTDYCQDRKKDQLLINVLKKHYEKVYFWIQGSRDLDYFNSLKNTEGVELISPNIESYEKVLNRGNIDYVGTRLHAGIFAMKHMVRSIILIVDNRARDMKETYNLVAIERDDINQLDTLINSSFETDVRINEKRIAEWKAQFK